MYNISDEIINFFTNTRAKWRMKLPVGRHNLKEVKIRRSIFQEDPLSPLFFVLAMIPLNNIFRKYTVSGVQSY